MKIESGFAVAIHVMSRRARGLHLAVMLALLVAVLTMAPMLAEASAASLVEIQVADAVVIESASDESFHVLLSFPGLDDLAGKTVISARLVLPTIAVEAPIRLQSRALSRAWSPGSVSWSSPWTRDGGDYREGTRGSCQLRPDREASLPTFLNVSAAVRGIVNDGDQNYGFVLLPDRPLAGREGGIPSALRSSFASLNDAKLLVLCAAEY